MRELFAIAGNDAIITGSIRGPERRRYGDYLLTPRRVAASAKVRAITDPSAPSDSRHLFSIVSPELVPALAHASGTEWRVEDIQFNPLANLPVAQIGVYFINGAVKDYTVQVTDNVGSFYVEANDNDAWPERAFRFAGWEMVA
jgi:hypothetical protein